MEDINTIEIILAMLLAVSEVLGSFGVFKNNSLFKLVISLLKRLAGKK